MALYSPVQVIKEKAFLVPPETLWEIVSNTEHLNRMIGLPVVTYREAEDSSDGIFRWAQAKLPPFGLVRWKEFPFEWVKPDTYRIRRVFENGPFLKIEGGIDIEARPTGALLRVIAQFTPRHFLGRLAARQVANKAVTDTLAYAVKTLREEDGKMVVAPPMPKGIKVSQAHLKSAEIRLAELATFPKWTVQRLIHRLETTSDEQVLDLRPFALADAWQLNRYDLLRLFLYATRAGMLEMEWQLMCPVCRVSKGAAQSLAALENQFHCDLCGVDYTANLDQAIELRFNVSPTIRVAQNEIYCLGGPVQTPHILCQLFLPPGGTAGALLNLPVKAHDFRLRVLRRNRSYAVQSRGGENDSSHLDCLFDGEDWSGNGDWIGLGPLELRLENSSKQPITVVFESTTPDDAAVTAAFVTTLQEFRTQFGSDVLAPGRDLAVRRICLLLTDLKASTVLYQEIGDAPALGRVNRHFIFLQAVIARHHGSVVKTMGDAVLAVFYHAADALAAALEIQSDFNAFNQEQGFDPPLIIKLGLNLGPVIAVTANEQIDYFGRTVNLVARMTEQSEGGDIVCPEELFLEPNVEAVWSTYLVTAEVFSLEVAGGGEALTLYRLRLPESIPDA